MQNDHKANFVTDDYGNPYVTIPLRRYESLLDSEARLDVLERLYLSGEHPTLVEILSVINSDDCNKGIKEIREEEKKNMEEWSKDHAEENDDV